MKKGILFLCILVLLLTPQLYAEQDENTPPAVKELKDKYPGLDIDKVEKLYREASLWRIESNVPKVDAARAELIKMGKPLARYLANEKIDVDESLQIQALIAIFQGIGQDAVPFLEEKLLDKPIQSVRNALYFLGEINAKGSADKIFALLEGQPDKSIMLSAFRTLAKFGDKRVISKIEPYTKDESEGLRITIAILLGNFPDDKVEPLLLTMLDDEMFSVRSAAVNSIVKTGKNKINFYIEALNKATERQKAELIVALGRFEDEKAIPALLKMLDEKDWLFRGAAAEALGKIGSDKALPQLEVKLTAEKHPFPSNMLQWAVKQIKSKKDEPKQ